MARAVAGAEGIASNGQAHAACGCPLEGQPRAFARAVIRGGLHGPGKQGRSCRSAAAASRPKTHIVITGIDESPAYYANHVEIGHSPHEFEMIFARLPAKLSEEKMLELKASGRLETEALARIIIPPSLMLDLFKSAQHPKGHV